MGANAQTTVPTFTAGAVLTAAQMNQSARTGVPVFATTADRDAAFGGAGEKTLAEGQMCYIEGAPNRLQVYDGSAWLNIDTKFTTFTPTWTNLTVGNATQAAQYIQIGKFVYVEGQLTFGTTTSISTNPKINYPVTADSTAPVGQTFFAQFIDVGSTVFYGVVQCEPTAVDFYNINVAGSYPGLASVTSTLPFTFGNTDVITYSFIYEAS